MQQSCLKALLLAVILLALSACKPDRERTWSGRVVIVPLGRLTSVGNLINNREPDRSLKGRSHRQSFKYFVLSRRWA